ncbi:hypothetical protein J7E99_28410 [Streptomyces sp. ISL-44]|uniref:hypothetical protein n=1 Tax=Streptomyces sp. ISL-44 TaxID=2819184 RepID=UPI001BE9BE94|nr:hypothetical protein [Streptomyces sp. ISL-44]MBT2544516.1 hypothetical protein [Streptomyces sp. ISL-44]
MRDNLYIESHAVRGGSGDMELTISVRMCDQCKSKDRPTTRYTLALAGSAPRERDLCEEDAAPLRALFGDDLAAQGPPELAPLERAEAAIRAAAENVTAEVPEQQAAPTRKPQARKAAEKDKPARTSGRRSKTPVMTMDEIEAMKAGKADES